MSTYNGKTVLQDLSAEVFFEIFDYFHFIELYNTFSNLNRRIDGYLDHLSNIYLYFSKRDEIITTKLKEKQLLYVRSIKFNWLTWSKDDQQHGLQEFFIQYPLASFQKLRSLTLSSITSNTEFPIIIDQLPLLSNLTSLDIQFDLYKSNITIDELRHVYETIFRYCITLKRLDITIYDDLDPRTRTRKEALFTQPIATQIEHLRFYELYMEEFDCILSPLSLPRVKSLTATIYHNPQQMYFSREGLALDFLTTLWLDFECTIGSESLESILKRTPNLKTFVITASDVGLIDYQKWQYFLSKYLLKVVKLHLHAYDWCDNEWFKRNEYLDFQTSTYWLTERGGAVQTECKQVWDEMGNEIDSISVTFRTTAFRNWQVKCMRCIRYE